MGQMGDLQDALESEYGSAVSAKICNENAMRMLDYRFP
jgi:hypothetical protein